jgi:hypothetical protein
MFSDGRWHTLRKAQQKTGLDKDQIYQIVSFLKEYDFMVVDEKSKKIKLEETVRRFLTQTTSS